MKEKSIYDFSTYNLADLKYTDLQLKIKHIHSFFPSFPLCSVLQIV